MSSYIFSVGKPGHGKKTISAIHNAGYKAGLIMDSNSPCSYADMFDHVVSFDFSSIERSIASTGLSQFDIKGLLCTYENYIIAKAKIGAALSVPSLSLEAAERCTDKSLMRQAFMDYRPSITPNFREVATLDDALQFATQFSYPLMLKPANLVKSLLVLKCENESELIQNYQKMTEEITDLYAKYNIYGRAPKIIIEEFITGDMYSVAAFVDQDGEVFICDDVVALNTAQQIGRSDNYLYRRLLPSSLPEAVQQNMYDIARQGIAALGLTASPAHVELIRDAAGMTRIIEIGARIGGYRPRMYALSYGYDLIAAEIAIAVNEAPQVSGVLSSHTAVYELFPEHSGTLIKINNLPDSDTLAYCSIKANPGDYIGTAADGHKATCVIIVSAPEESLLHALMKNVDAISIEVAS